MELFARLIIITYLLLWLMGTLLIYLIIYFIYAMLFNTLVILFLYIHTHTHIYIYIYNINGATTIKIHKK